jgi:hypothetical protein
VNQTSWIAAFVFVGFFVYITVKGQLPQYQAAIFGPGKSTASSATTPTAEAESVAAGQ